MSAQPHLDRPSGLRRVGHKGADLITPGNTIESFEAAVAAGVDTIEFDVLWTEDGDPRLPAAERAPLLIAHDWADAASRPHLTLDDALGAFTRPPLDRVEIDLDLKLQGREAEIAAAVREHGLVDRAMVSTMEIPSLLRVREAEPDLRRGWTYPRVTKDWRSRRWAAPGVIGGLAYMRRRLPIVLARETERLGAFAVWVFHPVITPRLIETASAASIEVIAWTVDDLDRMRQLTALGVDGICSNDPRLLAEI